MTDESVARTEIEAQIRIMKNEIDTLQIASRSERRQCPPIAPPSRTSMIPAPS